MLKAGKMWLLLACLAFLAGCQPVDSFNPLYQDKDIVFDPTLLGKWTAQDLTLEVIQSDKNVYTFVFTDTSTPPEHMIMEARLISLGGHRFLDLVPKKWTVEPDSYLLSIEQGKDGPTVMPGLVHAGDAAYIQFSSTNAAGTEMHLKLAHWFFKVTMADSHLSLSFIDDGRLSETLDQNKIQISHILVGPTPKAGESDNRQLALTASTADLQKFVLDHVNDDQVFADSIKLTRSTQ